MKFSTENFEMLTIHFEMLAAHFEMLAVHFEMLTVHFEMSAQEQKKKHKYCRILSKQLLQK